MERERRNLSSIIAAREGSSHSRGNLTSSARHPTEWVGAIVVHGCDSYRELGERWLGRSEELIGDGSSTKSETESSRGLSLMERNWVGLQNVSLYEPGPY